MTETVLFVYPGNTGDPDASGGQKRVYHLIDQLRTECAVHVLETEGDGTGEHPLKGVRRHTLTHPLPRYLIDFDPRVALSIRSLVAAEGVDSIHVSFPSGVASAVAGSRLTSRSPPVVFDAQSVASSFIDEVTTEADIPLYKKVGGRYFIPFIEWLAPRLADRTHVVSDGDRRLFGERYGVDTGEFVVVPCGVPEVSVEDDREAIRRAHDIPVDDRTVVFHGICSYPPNREAMEYLKREVAPELAAEFDDVSVVLAGKDVPESNSSGVRAVGFVDDLYSFLNAMDIAAVPLQSGGGVKMKTLDYMAVGLPIVTTTTGAEGIDIEDRDHAHVADLEGGEFIDRLKTLLDAPDERDTLARTMSELVADRYRWEHSGSVLADSLGGLNGD